MNLKLLERETEPVKVAEDLADLFLLAQARADEPEVVETLLRVIDRHAGEQPSAVRVAEAASRLKVSVPTVRLWIERGILEEAPGAGVRRVTAVSLGWALAAVRKFGKADAGRRKLVELLDSMRDRDLLSQARRALDESHEEDLIEYSDGDLEELKR